MEDSALVLSVKGCRASLDVPLLELAVIAAGVGEAAVDVQVLADLDCRRDIEGYVPQEVDVVA